MVIETGPVPDLLDRAAALWPDKVAIEYREHSITFGALARMVDRMAAGMLRAVKFLDFAHRTPWSTENAAR